MNYQTSKQWTITLLLCVLTFNSVTAQFFKKFYDKVLKRGTVYLTTNLSNSIEADESSWGIDSEILKAIYLDPSSSSGSLPDGAIIDNTPVYPFDYRVGF